MRIVIARFAQIVVLLALSKAGQTLATRLELPLPGSLVGMLLLLTLLLTGAVPLSWIESGASLLLRHLGFFFIPITVGLMGFTDVFVANGPAIVVTLVVSAVVGLCLAGLISQRLAARRERAS